MASQDAFIRPVEEDELARAIARRTIDEKSNSLRQAEWAYIAARRAAAGIQADNSSLDYTTAIALSGGGIRSAIFCLGVLQALAKRDLLKGFDYLSSVSGGGYIASSLTWFSSQREAENDPRGQPFGVDCSRGARPFPYGDDDPREVVRHSPETPTGWNLRWLREHGSYLIPGNEITILSGIAVVLRGLILNLIVWLPILAALFGVLLWSRDAPRLGLARLVPGFESLPGFGAFSVMPPVFQWMAAIGILAALLFVVWSIVYSLSTAPERGDGSSRYQRRRAFEVRAPWLLWTALGGLVLGTVPLVSTFTQNWIVTKGGVGPILLGGVTALWTHVQTQKREPSPLPLGVVAPIGALLVLYGGFLLSYNVADWALYGGPDAATPAQAGMNLAQRTLVEIPLHRASIGGGVGLFVGFAVAALTGWLANLNYISLNRFYRDRLMEAFMPNVDRDTGRLASPATAADPARLSEMCRSAHPVGPYHLVNTNLILTYSDDRVRHTRGGDSFLLSPLWCGSNATGWRTTGVFMNDSMTLPTAMAISGAAENPSASGFGGGVERNPFVAVLMALLNIRLGYWVPNPNEDLAYHQDIRPNHFSPGFAEFLNLARAEDSRMLQLSDGGHFDNLGLYELIRRRVRLIVAVDATADPDYAFADLQNATTRVRADFGATIDFGKEGLAALMPSQALSYPAGVKRSKQGHALAEITYSDGSKGVLVFVTTALIDKLRLELLGYKGANPDFPDESTLNQFFDEARFEAYRELGFSVSDEMLNALDLGAMFDQVFAGETPTSGQAAAPAQHPAASALLSFAP